MTINFSPQNSGNFSASAIVTYVYSGTTYVLSLGFTGAGASDLNFGGITLVDDVQATTATAHWVHEAGAVSYLIFYQNVGGSRTFVGSVNAPTDNYAVTGLTEGTNYTFEVQAVDFNSGITTSTATYDITTVDAPILTTISDQNFPSDNLVQTVAMTTIDVNNTVTGDDTDMDYTCHWDKVVDGAVNSATAEECTDIIGTATFNASTGVFDWTPNNNAFGAYEIMITGNLYSGESTDTELFVLDVRSNYPLANLLIDLDAQFTNYTNAIATGATQSTWRNIHTTGASYDGDLNGVGLETSWQGDGLYTDPYSLAFTGASSHFVDLGTGVNSETDLMLSMWINPANAAELGPVIVGNKGNGGNGFEIRQSPDNAGKLRFMIGTTPAIVPYNTRVLNYSPVAYYRFDETTGTPTARDTSGSSPANDGTYSANVTLEQTGAIAGNDAVRFTGTAPSYIDVPDSSDLDMRTNGLTLSTWVYLEGTGNYRALLGKGTNPYDYLWSFTSGTRRHTLYLGTANATWANTSSSDVPLNTWTHIAVSFDPVTRELQHYTNGVPDGSYTTASGTMVNTAAVLEIGNMINHAYPLTGSMDELVLYNYVLTDAQVYNLYANNPIECESTTTLTDNEWVNISALYDSGTDTAKLYVNGTEECSVIYGNTFTPATTALGLGARVDGSQAWTGAIANMKLYSSGTAGEISTIVSETRTAFIDAGNIVTDNLVLNLDAANANGTGFPGAGCAYTNWVDLSDNAFTGTLTNFASCDAESGWNGDGSTSDPYTLDFNSTAPDDYVSFADNAELDIPNEISIMLWLKPDAFTAYHALVGKGTNPYNYLLSIASGTQRISLYTQVNPTWANTNNTDLTTGQWQHVAVTFNATTGDMQYYFNGATDGYYSLSTGTMPDTSAILEIGNMINNGYPYDGSISNVMIYDRALDANEIYQNCLAHNGNFAGVTCAQ
jgi:hypothetical protein